MNQLQMTRLAVFQYMTSNTDWALTKLHNVKLLFVNNNMSFYPVPYDFDWSGFVNAPYAAPAPQIGTTHVCQHTYRGYQRLLENIKLFLKNLIREKKQFTT